VVSCLFTVYHGYGIMAPNPIILRNHLGNFVH